MLTESQKRALRAKTLLDMGGHDPKMVARECGYTSVSAMLGAIVMCDGIPASHTPAEKPLRTRAVTREQDSPEGKTMTMTIYPVEDGKIWIRKQDISVSYRPNSKKGPTVHINDEYCRRTSGYTKWIAFVGNECGGKAGLACILRQIAAAASECAALIEDEVRGGE